MLRRKFLQNITWLTGGLLLSRCLPAKTLGMDGKSLKGTVRANGKGIRNVVVSDGYSVVKTDKKGRYTISPNPEAQLVFVSIPAGYAFNHENGIVRHYRFLQQVNPGNDVNFDLVPLTSDDNEHEFIIWADPQVKNANDVRKMMQQTVPDVKELVAASWNSALVHGITVGDIVWDELKLFQDYDKAVAAMGIPFFQCLGNHDMDYRKGGDETSDDTFMQTYGPAYYSFNRGQAHYVVMDNVRYLGTDRDYDGFFQQHQLDWLQKDLQEVSNDKLIILCVHIPVHRGTKNNEALYKILEGRKVHIMSGHTHYHLNAINGDIYEHNHGTVCGAWWTGDICGDGTPNGYGVYRVKGNEITWQYKATGKPIDYQMKVYADKYDETQTMVKVNIWNHDPQWKTEYYVDGVLTGNLEQFDGFDPIAFTTLSGPSLPKQRGFAEPKQTSHLFRAFVPSSAKEVKVVATDRFGKTYSQVHQLQS